jgi:hypothetical protein
MPGAQCTRSRACSVESTRVSHHESTGSPGIPARNGFNGFLRALPGDRALLPPSSAKVAFRRLDASVGASGPHDFAVRRKAPSSSAPPASTASHPAFVTIMIRPSLGWDGASSKSDLGQTRSGIFLQRGLDWANQLDPAQEIRRHAQVRRADLTLPGGPREKECRLASPTGPRQACARRLSQKTQSRIMKFPDACALFRDRDEPRQ